jgi:hypothetical protein
MGGGLRWPQSRNSLVPASFHSFPGAARPPRLGGDDTATTTTVLTSSLHVAVLAELVVEDLARP